MYDMIEGYVYRVIDGDTFDIEVTYTAGSNDYEYENDERIRIAEIDAPELNTKGGNAAKEDLERIMLRRKVRCFIRSRDFYNRLVAKVILF